MFSLSFPMVVVALHAGEAVSFATYLLRVAAYLLAFAGIAVGAFWSVRAVELVRSAVRRRRRTTRSDP